MQSEFVGINKLRRGALLLIVTSILLGVIGFIFGIMLLSTATTFGVSAGVSTNLHTVTAPTMTSSTTPSQSSSAIGILIALAVVGIIGVILGIVGLLDIRNGFGILKNFGRDVEIGYIGATLYFIALILVALGILIISGSIALIGGILVIVSNVLVGIGFYKLGEIYNEGTTKIGGILVAIPISIISFIGFILAYIGLGNVKPMGTVAPYVQPNYSPMGIQTIQPAYQIYQVGQGIIRGNGYAKISLYSSSQATLLSARIEGTTSTSVYVNPIVLQPGYNEVAIQFNNVSSLTPGSNYLVTLVVNIGGNVSEVKATAIYQP